MSHNEWNDERLKLLRKGRADDLSNAEIARLINSKTGSAFTRNACIGKALRLGLAVRKTNTSRPQRQTPRRAERRDTNFRQPVEIAPVELGSLNEVESVATPTDFIGIAFFDLKQHHCRYPRGASNGTPILYCGQPKIKHSSYCAACHARCHAGRVYLGRAA